MRAFTLLAAIALIGSFLASPAVAQVDWDSFDYAEFAVEPEHQHHQKHNKIHSGKSSHGQHHVHHQHHGKYHPSHGKNRPHHGKHQGKGAHPHHHKQTPTAAAASYDDEYDDEDFAFDRIKIGRIKDKFLNFAKKEAEKPRTGLRGKLFRKFAPTKHSYDDDEYDGMSCPNRLIVCVCKLLTCHFKKM
ncbi:hypothetical protein BC828DRAFT_46322, partial [Blastocladiella britannica]